MDELLIYLRTLFVNDVILKGIFVAAGQPEVSCVSISERITASYPRIILFGNEGNQLQYGDNIPKFFKGSFNVEAVARKTDLNQTPLATVRAIEKRIRQLVLGAPQLNPSIHGLQGTVVGSDFRVDVVDQVWSQLLPKYDPTVERWGVFYNILLNQYVVNIH